MDLDTEKDLCRAVMGLAVAVNRMNELFSTLAESDPEAFPKAFRENSSAINLALNDVVLRIQRLSSAYFDD